MSAQQSNQTATTQTTSQGEQRGRQTSLARSSRQTTPSLWMDPLDTLVNPFAIFRRMQEEVSRALGQTGRGFSSAGEEIGSSLWAPVVDLEYRDGKLEVTAELPGVQENDVKVELNNNSLIIHGERKVEHEEHQGGIRRIERSYGQFYRTIPLPEGAEAENAQAELQNGVLHVTVPVSQANVRQIPVQTSGTSQRRSTSQGSSSPEKAA